MQRTKVRSRVLAPTAPAESPAVDKPLARVARRLQRVQALDAVVIAAAKEGDKALLNESMRLRVPVSVGSEVDVLDRYYCAARAQRAAVVVRVTSDCPHLTMQSV